MVRLQELLDVARTLLAPGGVVGDVLRGRHRHLHNTARVRAAWIVTGD